MFDMFNMSDGIMTGLELAVLSSADAADTAIEEFKRKYRRGQDPQFVLDSIVDDLNVEDIFPEDVERIKENINDYLEAIGVEVY